MFTFGDVLRSFIAMLAITLPMTASAQRTVIPSHGGSGGGDFDNACPQYSYLAGFRIYLGSDLDAISPICAPLGKDGARGPLSAINEHPFNGTVGAQQLRELVCTDATRAPFVVKVEVHAEGVERYIVNGLRFWCGSTNGAPVGQTYAALGPRADKPAVRGYFAGELTLPAQRNMSCPGAQLPTGVHGRAGLFVDSLGIACQKAESAPLSTVALQNPASGGAATASVGEDTRSVATSSRLSRTQIAGTAAPTTIVRSRAQAPTVAGSVTDSAASRLDATNRIVCHGGPALNIEIQPNTSPQDGGMTLRIIFPPQQRAAHADGSGLPPGSCGFVTRAWDSFDPPALVFQGKPDQASEIARIAARLRDAAQYWNFEVAPGYGNFRVVSQAEMTAAAVAAQQVSTRRDCRSGSGLIGNSYDLSPRLERIKCEQANLDAGELKQAAERLDAFIQWLEKTQRP